MHVLRTQLTDKIQLINLQDKSYATQ